MPALLLPLLFTLLASCGGDEEPDGAGAESRGEFNDADVAFATAMIPHHAQALAMVDLTMGRDLDPALAALTEQIRAAQTPEIETMTDWLTSWDEPVPETVRDHANAHDDMDMDDSEMPGMMSAEDLDELAELSGAEFEQEWLELMIEHHEGAVEMAEDEIEDGAFPGAITLAEEIVKGQTVEIDQMEQMLTS